MEGVEVLHPEAGIAVVALHAEHDVTTKSELAALLLGEIARNNLVVVDVSEALFIDSSFLHNLVQADRAAAALGSRFVLQMGTAHIVRRALEVSGLLGHLNVAHTRAAALTESGNHDGITSGSGVVFEV